jgi:ketosteroid isomerase-like protein
MSVYIPDQSLFVFDAVSPRQYVGAKAFRKDFEEFLACSRGRSDTGSAISAFAASGVLVYSHRIDTWTLTDKAGKRVTLVFRVTDVYRKINGMWLIVHEHISFPVDPTTGKADMLSKP